MADADARFDQIAETLRREEPGVARGPMLSSPGITYRGKVFAFFHDATMGFRLGKAVDPDALSLATVRPLNPFRTKPPLPGWFVVSAAEQDRWEDLARLALGRLVEELAGTRRKEAG